MKKFKSRKKIAQPSPSERRQIENEVVFRNANEQIQKDLDELRKKAKAEGHDSLIPDKDLDLHFYCECSDENCRERIVLALSKYKQLHQDRSQFIVSPKHETTAIEDVVSKKITYTVVEKFIVPPEKATMLKSTPIHNV